MFATYKSFKTINSDIRNMSNTLKSLQLTGESSVKYFANKFGIDSQRFADWLTGSPEDLSELVVLYLDESKKQMILQDIQNLSTALSAK